MREALIPGRQIPPQKKSRAQIEQEAIDWHVRLHAADADAVVQKAFADWLAEDAGHGPAYEAIDALWASTEFAQALGDLQTRAATPPQLERRRSWRLPAWQYGLAAVVLFASVAAWQLPEFILRSQADFLTESGAVAQYVLPDGSSVTLNTNSAIEIDFSDDRRSVALLRGEAFFAVVPDSARPFAVLGQQSQVTVTGTAFSLRSQSDQDLLTVEEGHVLFQDLQAEDAVALMAGQAATVGQDGLSMPVAVDVRTALEWREGRLTVTDLPLWEAIEELQRYRAAPVLLANSDRRELLVSGSFRLSDIDDGLRTIAATAGLAVTELPASILILH